MVFGIKIFILQKIGLIFTRIISDMMKNMFYTIISIWFFINMILSLLLLSGLIGFYYIWKGRNEFNNKHLRNIRLSRVFFFYAVLILLFSLLLFPFMDSSTYFILHIFRLFYLIFGLLWIIYLIVEIVEPGLKKILWSALLISVSLMIIDKSLFTIGVYSSSTSTIYDIINITQTFIPPILIIYCYQQLLRKMPLNIQTSKD